MKKGIYILEVEKNRISNVDTVEKFKRAIGKGATTFSPLKRLFDETIEKNQL